MQNQDALKETHEKLSKGATPSLKESQPWARQSTHKDPQSRSAKCFTAQPHSLQKEITHFSFINDNISSLHKYRKYNVFLSIKTSDHIWILNM